MRRKIANRRALNAKLVSTPSDGFSTEHSKDYVNGLLVGNWLVEIGVDSLMSFIRSSKLHHHYPRFRYVKISQEKRLTESSRTQLSLFERKILVEYFPQSREPYRLVS